MLGSLVGEPVERGTARSQLRVIDTGTDAFRDLVERQLDASYRLAAVILGDRTEAEDAVHDAAVAAWRGFAALRDRDRFDAWFRRILVNGCRDRLRVRARRRVLDVGRELVEAEHPRVADPSDATAVRDALARAMAALGPDEQVDYERVTITMSYDILGWPRADTLTTSYQLLVPRSPTCDAAATASTTP